MKVEIYTKEQILAAPVDSNLRCLEPGYAGDLEDEQVDFIRRHLRKSMRLAAWWGFTKKPRRASDTIRRIAMDGDPDDITWNRKLAKGARYS